MSGGHPQLFDPQLVPGQARGQAADQLLVEVGAPNERYLAFTGIGQDISRRKTISDLREPSPASVSLLSRTMVGMGMLFLRPESARRHKAEPKVVEPGWHDA